MQTTLSMTDTRSEQSMATVESNHFIQSLFAVKLIFFIQVLSSGQLLLLPSGRLPLRWWCLLNSYCPGESILSAVGHGISGFRPSDEMTFFHMGMVCPLEKSLCVFPFTHCPSTYWYRGQWFGKCCWLSISCALMLESTRRCVTHRRSPSL